MLRLARWLALVIDYIQQPGMGKLFTFVYWKRFLGQLKSALRNFDLLLNLFMIEERRVAIALLSPQPVRISGVLSQARCHVDEVRIWRDSEV